MRSSPAAIVIGWLQTAVGMLAVVLVWSTAGRRLDGGIGTAVDLAFWAYVVLRTAGIPLGWLTTRWEVTEHGVRCRHGLLAREQTDVRWEEVVSFDVSQPALHRLFGCYTVRFGLGTTQKAALRIDAVSRRTRDRVVAVARCAQPGPGAPIPPEPLAPFVTGAVPAAAAPPPAEHEIYRIRSRDYLLVSLSYGSFVLLVPALVSVLDQVGDWLPLPVPGPAVVLGWPLPTQLAAGLALLALSVAYGWLFTWLRYRGFRVVVDESGYLTSGGLLQSATRRVAAAQVTGLKVTQNPIMRALGYGRVSVLTTDAGDQPMANLLFPLVRLDALPAALPNVPVPAELVAPTLRLSTPARAVLVVGFLTAWAGLLGLAHQIRPEWLLATGTVVSVTVALLANACWVVATSIPDRAVCYVRRGVFWLSHVEVAAGAIRLAQSSQGPLGRLTHHWSVVLHYYDGRVRVVRAFGCSAEQRRALTELVLTELVQGDPLPAGGPSPDAGPTTASPRRPARALSRAAPAGLGGRRA